MAQETKSFWAEDGVAPVGRIAAGFAGIGLVVLFALGWKPPNWLTSGVAGILFYCMVLIAIIQLGELVWQWIKSK